LLIPAYWESVKPARLLAEPRLVRKLQIHSFLAVNFKFTLLFDTQSSQLTGSNKNGQSQQHACHQETNKITE
jgi:hypothetical protein